MKRSCSLLLVTIILWFGLPISSASAHAELVATTPSRGAQITAPPSQVKLEFGENLLSLGDAKTNTLSVTDPSGKKIDKADSKLSGRFLTVSLKQTAANGTYTVSWRVVSDDGHPVQGSFHFSVGPTMQIAPSSSPTSASSPYLEKSFWNQYQPRILLGIGALIALFIWTRFKFLEKRSKIK